jgi:hypothetical protein
VAAARSRTISRLARCPRTCLAPLFPERPRQTLFFSLCFPVRPSTRPPFFFRSFLSLRFLPRCSTDLTHCDSTTGRGKERCRREIGSSASLPSLVHPLSLSHSLSLPLPLSLSLLSGIAMSQRPELGYRHAQSFPRIDLRTRDSPNSGNSCTRG